jgi:cytochrome c oxidase subunit 2
VSSQDRTSGRAKALRFAGVAAVGVLALAGCTPEAKRGWLPIEDPDTTNHTRSIMELWNHSWIASLVIGLITWGLALWCIVAYRRRKGDTGYPRQLSYSMPLEIFYTAVPLVLVITFFTFSNRTQQDIDKPADSDLVVNVYGKQWSWDFNYDYQGDKHYLQGVQVHEPGKVVDESKIPTLYLPVDTPVQFDLNSRDVNHSFWVPEFLQKLDMIPGKTNHIYLTPQREGSYHGKCAELCGEYHSEMLFNVEVVSVDEFKAQMAKLPEGEVGSEANRLGVEPTEDPTHAPTTKEGE